MRAKRVDGNQRQIISALEAAGASVVDASRMGQGFPDLVIGYRNVTLLMECKDPKTAYGKKGANQNQKAFMETWKGGPVAIVDGPEAALRALGVL